MIYKLIRINILLLLISSAAFADTPANCTFDDLTGDWVFYEGTRGNDNTLNCSDKVNIVSQYKFRLDFPNLVVDQDGYEGSWTIVYNQGFEIVVNNRKYFAFSYYEQDGKNVTSVCSRTMWGWAHETGVHPSDWSCAIGNRTGNYKETRKVYDLPLEHIDLMSDKNVYKKNLKFVDGINKKQSSWTAIHYNFMDNMKISDLVRMAGGKKSRILNKPKPARVSVDTKKEAQNLPKKFDWRNINEDGKLISYLSPVRNQGACGSCYAFGSLGMNEARLRISTNNTVKTILSTQDIVECAKYSQGCDGGFSYLIAGKYAEDFGLAEESCNPYTGKDGSCSTKTNCERKFSTTYHYVGGFYGACNEDLMKIELVNNGPLAVAFEVYDDFMNYKNGIYHHTFTKDTKNYKFNPFQLTNHAVLLVGYGTDEMTGENYWSVKNSWGKEWGEDGFFRIHRGTDECAIESIAVGSYIVI